MMLKRLLLALCGLFFIELTALADEGMWLLPLLKQYNFKEMQRLGFAQNDSYIYNEGGPSLKDAVVRFGRGCTGEFISYKGLILTNHHCGYNAIQQHSSVEHDYLRDGFWAHNQADEIPTPGLTVTVLVRMEDVTNTMLKDVPDSLSLLARSSILRPRGDSLLQAASEGTHYVVEIKPFYEHNKYYLMVYEVFKDVRLVGAPPSAIGKFGGETDNWMYPRHTGDFSLFRVYANQNNEPADYSPDNIPYKPKKALTVSLSGINEGDFAMILGNPGSTNRYMTSWEVKQVIDVRNKARAEVRGVKQAVWKEHMNASQAVRIKYAAKYAQSSNYWKNAIGQNLALEKLGIVKNKEAEEEKFTNWISDSQDRYMRYKDVLPTIQRTNAALTPIQIKQFYGTETFFRGMELFSFGNRHASLRKAIKDNDTATLNKYKNSAKVPLENTWFKDYDMPTDRATAKALIKYFKESMPDSIHPPLYQTIKKDFKGDIDAFVDKMYATSFLADYERWKSFLKNPSLKKLDSDLGYLMTESTQEWMHKDMEQAIRYNNEFATAMQKYLAGRLEMLGNAPSYPDANSTMRLTYGTIKGYTPRDGVAYNYYTTLKGVIEKDNPKSDEFAVPERLKSLYAVGSYGAYANAKGELPVAFISNNDITGGNSGSPVLNKEGHLIGCAFDGNWEALSGDIAFEQEKQRCINVDIRYILFIIERYAGCTRLIDELQLVRD